MVDRKEQTLLPQLVAAEIREAAAEANQADDEEKTTIITLPIDQPERMELLQAKQKHYQERLSKQRERNRYAPPEAFIAWIECQIINTLFEEGVVDTWALSLKIFGQIGINEETWERFNRYCGIIEDYVLTGGANTSKG